MASRTKRKKTAQAEPGKTKQPAQAEQKLPAGLTRQQTQTLVKSTAPMRA